MHHVGTITKSSRLPKLPFHAQCTCGTAGSFPEKEFAVTYMNGHGQNVKANNVANTFELVDNSDKPEVLPAKPLTHIPGVGNMPTSHAAGGATPPSVTAGGPPPPPPPPDAKKSESESESAVK